MIKGEKYEGYQYPDEVNDWFSAAIERKVVVIHTPSERQTKLNTKRTIMGQETDTRKTFCSDAALHIVNRASVDELRKRV